MKATQPILFAEKDFDHLPEMVCAEAQLLLYRQDVQEAVVELKAQLENQTSPEEVRLELRRRLKNFPLKSRKWESFLWGYVADGRIIDPYAGTPSEEDIRQSVAQARSLDEMSQKLKNDDMVQLKLDDDMCQQAVRMVGTNIFNTDTVSVQVGAAHVALFLTKDATLEDVKRNWKWVQAAQKYFGKGRIRTSALRQLHVISYLYRMGSTTPKAIRGRLPSLMPSVILLTLSEDAVREQIKKAGELGFISKVR